MARDSHERCRRLTGSAGPDGKHQILPQKCVTSIVNVAGTVSLPTSYTRAHRDPCPWTAPFTLLPADDTSLARTIEHVVPLLRAGGLDEDLLETLLVRNPSTVLAA